MGEKEGLVVYRRAKFKKKKRRERPKRLVSLKRFIGTVGTRAAKRVGGRMTPPVLPRLRFGLGFFKVTVAKYAKNLVVVTNFDGGDRPSLHKWCMHS